MNFIKELFTYNDISIEVNVSTEDKSVWLSQKDMGILFNKAQPTISRWINIILEEASIEDKNGGTLSEEIGGLLQFAKLIIPSENDNSQRPTTYYNLPLILEVGRRLKSSIVSIFEEWCNDILNPQIIEQPSNIIKFDNGIISLDVRVEPSEKEVYLNQEQLALLFATSKQNISYHINNIFASKELEINSVVKISFTTATDGKRYSVSYYNLDMILYLGFRMNSPRGIEFRHWALDILTRYLRDGYAFNYDRISKVESCYVQLQNEYNELNNRVNTIEDHIKESTLEEEIILEDMEHNFITLVTRSHHLI